MNSEKSLWGKGGRMTMKQILKDLRDEKKILKKPQLIGGIIGILLCLVLFFFYIQVYFPIINQMTIEETEKIPSIVMALPLITGHMFPLFSHFFVEGTALDSRLCPATEPVCSQWSAMSLPCNIPWTSEGIKGCCQERYFAPTTACTNRVEGGVFYGLAFLLLVVYFLIGMGIGKVVWKRFA